jgi:superfamily I DNA and RNA helicase
MSELITIIRGTNDKPVSSQSLAEYFANDVGYTGHLFVGYPIIGTSEGKHPIDALLVSPEKGIVIFDLIEGNDLGEYGIRQDDSANKLEARLKTHRELMRRRDLLVPINTISVAPAVSKKDLAVDGDYSLVNLDSLTGGLDEFSWDDRDGGIFEATLSVIQSISTIRKSRIKRVVTQGNSRGAKLKKLEDSIATLDSLQGKAVIETVNDVQRIRGLAGSGKTIILALKAAYLHAQHPDWRIAVTFNTRSLKGQFKRMINNFSLEQAGEEPDWGNLRVINAWGAPGGGERDGVYHEYCRTHDIQYLDFRAAKSRFPTGNEFAGVCEQALGQAKEEKSLYDAILVDEAQDFPPAFLRLCYEMLGENKRLVYAYDELQNLSGTSLPAPDEIFGLKTNGEARVQFEETEPGAPRRDIILEKCYRNSGPVLVTAHAMGFGIYRKSPKQGSTGLVQMFDYPELWAEIGYQLKRGELKDGAKVVLRRTEESSPRFLEDHSPIVDLIQFVKFESENEQTEWLINEIKKNISKEELRHDDIVVINPDPLSTRNRVGIIRRRLLDIDINSHLAGIDTDPDVFFKPDSESITFTGIYRAKGNEAGMVYIVNAHDCHTSWNLASVRNRLFTAITRSKAWVRVLGIGEGMQSLIDEYERLKAENFELNFDYPTKEQREHLKMIHRDMTIQERSRLEARKKDLTKLVKDLEDGIVMPDDLDEELRQKLRDLLDKKV